MTPDEFGFIAGLIRERSGFVLTRDKGYLIENRLSGLVRRHRMKGVSELIAAIRDGVPDLEVEAVDAMMTKDTGFFRDWKPFIHLRDVLLPQLAAARTARKVLRILCAGVSTGQEAYSVAMVVRQQERLFEGWTVEIIGVDLSASAIAAAERGCYTQFEVQRGLPIRILARAFAKQGESWAIDPSLKSMVAFRPWNLLDDLVTLGRFDVVLCRNVLAYFDLQAKAAVLARLAGILAADGALFLGLSETVTGVSTRFQTVDANLALFAQSGAKASL